MIPFTRKRARKLSVVPYRHHPKFKWTLSGYYVDGKRVRRFFKTKDEAEGFARQVEIQIENLGSRAIGIDPRLHYMALDAHDKLAGYGKTISEAAEFYTRHLDTLNRSCSVDELVAGFLQDKELDGKRKRTMHNYRWRLERFQRKFGKRIVATITTSECDDWLRGLGLSPISRINYRRVLFALFAYALVRGYAIENPIAKIAKPKTPDAPIEVFTPEQVRALLDAAEPSILPFLAIGAFAGLRHAEICRLDWSEVKLDRNFIEVTALKSKTASRRLVTIQPNLKAWLAPFARPRGKVEPPNSRKLREAAQRHAGIDKWPTNALRHSFASFHLAKFQDAPALALQMGHTTTAMLFAHYREVVTPEAAETYWKIEPQRNNE
ncbi:MAG TPA: tyrosine-type recombinase/integrase [Bryobacteraceae bacterium]|nr:tyrosine-type recombinase/integrase [Bryobacteraceae bacterium]